MRHVRRQFSLKFLVAMMAAGLLLAWASRFCGPAQAQSLQTGPAIGESIPAFSVTDHTGKTRTFESLRGPKGLLLLFHRSADW